MAIHTNQLRVGDVMTKSPVTVTSMLPVEAAQKFARLNGVRYLLVELTDGVVGATCLHHLASASAGSRVADCVCDPSWLGPLEPQLSLSDAAGIMGGRAFRCLPVVANGHMLGVVTGGDLRRAGVAKEDATPVCASCGIRFHVHSKPGSPVAFCLECLERAEPPVSLQ